MPVVSHDGLGFAGLKWTLDILDEKLSGFIGHFQVPYVALHIEVSCSSSTGFFLK
jgi:hypothetical protein